MSHHPKVTHLLRVCVCNKNKTPLSNEQSKQILTTCQSAPRSSLRLELIFACQNAHLQIENSSEIIMQPARLHLKYSAGKTNSWLPHLSAEYDRASIAVLSPSIQNVLATGLGS